MTTVGLGMVLLDKRPSAVRLLAVGDCSGAHVLPIFVALGLIRVHRRDDIPRLLERADRLLALLPREQTEASVRLVRLILAVADGEDLASLEHRLEDAVLTRVVGENQHMAYLRDGVMGLTRGARGEPRRRGRGT